MKNDLLRALGERPARPATEGDWERAQKLKRELCEQIPAIVDAGGIQSSWTALFRYKPSDAVRQQVAEELVHGLIAINLAYRITRAEHDTLWVTVRTVDLKRAAVRERAKSDAARLEMMRSR